MEQQNWQEYLSEVEEWLIDCPILAKMQLMRGLREEVADFIQHMPDSTYEDLVELFGQPEYVARQLLDAIPPAERRAAQQRKKTLIAFSMIFMAALISALAFWLWYLSRGQQLWNINTIYVSGPYHSPNEMVE